MIEYVIVFSDGDYYQSRGGYDWGRSGLSGATVFESRVEAQAVANWVGMGARVIEWGEADE